MTEEVERPTVLAVDECVCMCGVGVCACECTYMRERVRESKGRREKEAYSAVTYIPIKKPFKIMYVFCMK